jgi:hypothetical protein
VDPLTHGLPDSPSRRLRDAAARALRACALAALIFPLAVDPARPQTDSQAAEYRVKAAFVYKFSGYIEWPDAAFARPDSPISIGVVGADALAEELAQVVVGRSVNGRPFSVRKLRPGDSIENLHILFIGKTDARRLAEILGVVKGRPVLTVTESEEALQLGSVINFVVVDDKVRFDVALVPADLGSLKISARLLAVARKVVKAS